MNDSVRVWIDDPNPIFRRGLACCLRQGGFVLAGESCGFIPEPDMDGVDVVVFDLGEPNVGWAIGQATDRSTRLIGLVAVEDAQRGSVADLCTVFVRSELTPESFLDCLGSLTGSRPFERPPEPVVAEVTRTEVEILRQLADGRTLREIARGLHSPEGAIRKIVRDLLGRMHCRNPAQAVALAVREGVI